METTPYKMSVEVELLPGEKLCLPESLVSSIGPGLWVITVEPLERNSTHPSIRDHSAFLSSYVPEDEGLYDDYPAR
jgi:hypothetical protein